jgi:hypothetical protein
LKGHFGEDSVFMDIDSIPFGLDFREHIQDSLDRCDILVAIVGPRWATPDESGRLRLTDETDWVRIEIEVALAKTIPVIPGLIDGAALPAPADLLEGLRNLALPPSRAGGQCPRFPSAHGPPDQGGWTSCWRPIAARPRRMKRRKSAASQRTRPRRPSG